MVIKKVWVIVFLVSFVLLLITSVAGAAFYFGQKSAQKSPTFSPTPTQTVNSLLQPSVQEAQSPLFSGVIKKTPNDLGLFKILEEDKLNNISSSIVYYEAGSFTRGAYKDYTRVIAIRPPEGPGPNLQYLLATKDYKTYVLHDPKHKTTAYPESDWENPYMYLDKTKISSAVTLPSDHPNIISLDAPFALLNQETVVTESVKNGMKDSNGYDIYIDAPVTQFAEPPLQSSQKQLSLHAKTTDWGDEQLLGDKEKKQHSTRTTYLNRTTQVFVTDSTGLTYSYSLSTQTEILNYLNSLPSYDQKVVEYKKQVVLYNEKKLKDYPSYPESLPFPGVRVFKASDGLSDGFYNTYDSAFPGACGGNVGTYVVDSLNENELDPVTSASTVPLFKLKDKMHPLNELAYQIKTDIEDEAYKSVNEGKSKPTFDEYIAKNPLLFFKDAWGRWAVVGEYDIKLMGGCGKPVVYLYPEKSTDVHLSFSSSVELRTQIPNYHGGWFVRATPDGVLTDLQPQYTDCEIIDSSKFGSEYAKESCANNSYPYIYWSGKSIQNPYPSITGGWIVEQEGLATFMSQKLEEMGLTKRESADMISYWVPKMRENNTPYYRISFIQTKDMNEFIPMHVSPKPDSVMRVFLDYSALSSKPTDSLKPQILQRFTRHGFAYVEWGGLVE